MTTGDQLLDACRQAGLSWAQAAWLAELPADAQPNHLTEGQLDATWEAIRGSLPGIASGSISSGERRGTCLEAEITNPLDGRRATARSVRLHALWQVATELAGRQSRGPSLLDDEGPAGDPRSILHDKWREWQSLAGDTTDYELAWLIGATRLLGIRIVNNSGRPQVMPGGRRAETVDPLVAMLRKHRDTVVDRLVRGLEFDDRQWQLELVRKAAGGWPVWGVRLDACRESVIPVIPHDPPPFYDGLLVYRPDCWRAIGEEPRAAIRIDTTARRLWPGVVYVGPPTADYPEGKGGALVAERKAREKHGHTFNPVMP